MFNARPGLSSLLAMAHKFIFAEGPTVSGRATRIPKNRHERKNMLIAGFDDQPRYYPGAKLARKASKGRLGIATLR